MKKQLELLDIIEREQPLRELIMVASREKRPDQWVYVRYIPWLFGAVNVLTKRSKPLSWFGLVEVMRFTKTSITDEDNMKTLLLVKRFIHTYKGDEVI